MREEYQAVLMSYALAPLVSADLQIHVTQREERRKDREGGSRWWGRGSWSQIRRQQ
jgi:hypothetical protein